MAVTQNTYTGNGSTVLYSFTFPYLETTDIKVSVNGTITTAYTLANATTIQFNTAPVNGAAIRIYRQTDDAALAATFYPGSAIRSSDLNENFTQNLYVTQESSNNAGTATSTANTALTNSNTAISTANTALSTANTASTNASAAVTTANTASTNASAAVSTANTASTNATTAVNTANAATTTANSAAADAATAISTANGAVSTANAASTAATNAVNTANAASSTASSAVSTANTASTNASNAVTTANTASTNATTAVNTANAATVTANAAAAAVANAVLYTTVANVAAIPATPANNTAVEVTNSTGIESFTPLSGLPVGFVGSSGLSVRIIYQTVGTTWTWIQYFPNDPEARYLKLAGGTVTGNLAVSGTLTKSGNNVVTVGDTGTVTSTMIANGTIVDADVNASAAIAGTKVSPDFGSQTVQTTGVFSHALGTAGAPTITFTGDTNTGIYSPGADQVAISTAGSGRLFVDASGRVGIGTGGTQSSTFHVEGTSRFVASNSALFNGTTGTYSTWLYNGTAVGDIGTGNQVFAGGANTDFALTSRSATALVLGTNTQERLRITSAGLVGIGTSLPQIQSWRTGTYLTIAGSGSRGQLEIDGSSADTSGANCGAVVFSASTSSTDHKHLAVVESYLDGATAGQRGGALKIWTKANGTSTPIAAVTIDSSQRVGIGVTSPAAPLDLSGDVIVRGVNSTVRFKDSGNTTQYLAIYGNSTDANINAGVNNLVFYSAGTERGRFDVSGRFLVGTSSARSGFANSSATPRVQLEGTSYDGSILSITRNVNSGGNPEIIFGKSRGGSVGSYTAVADGDTLGAIRFDGADGTDFATGAYISAQVDGTPGANDMPGRLVFSTTADGASSPTPRMTITSAGALRFGQITTDFPGSGNTTAGVALTAGGRSGFSQDSDFPLLVNRNTSDGTIVQINRQGSGVGSISVTTTATAYNTSSDYRLKENVTPVSDGITRLQQLKPSRFNFIADPDKTVDGFIAHEAQAVVPECVTGVKDAVDADGNPIYQGIDQSKLVPLLTAALQEAVAKIESLEARLTSAGL